MPLRYPQLPLHNHYHGKLPGHIEPSALVAGPSLIRDESCGLDRRSQQLLTRLRARVAAGEAEAAHFRPGDLEEWFAISPTTAQDWLRDWQEGGLLEPARPGQRIRSWQLREPWLAWVIGQLAREE